MVICDQRGRGHECLLLLNFHHVDFCIRRKSYSVSYTELLLECLMQRSQHIGQLYIYITGIKNFSPSGSSLPSAVKHSCCYQPLKLLSSLPSLLLLLLPHFLLLCIVHTDNVKEILRRVCSCGAEIDGAVLPHPLGLGLGAGLGLGLVGIRWRGVGGGEGGNQP